MPDDIVTRLRNWHDQKDSWQTLTEGADVIEQLRHQLQQWKATATLFYLHHDNRRSCSLLASCKQCDAYEALMKKEQQ